MTDPILARKMHRTLEPYHGLVYFAAEASAAYASLGSSDRQDGYFASRAAPMGAVGPEVVVATFFNFNPVIIHRALPAAWEIAAPSEWVAARFEGIDLALHTLLGDALGSPEVAEAAALAREAAGGCTAAGRPLCGGHLDVEWPEAPHLVLWHALSVLREFRGDGHVACLLTEGVSGIDALVVHGATGEIAPVMLQTTRAWGDEAWGEAEEGLRERGWLDVAGALTVAGRQHRDRVEQRTDELAMAPWLRLGEERCARLRALVRPLSKTILASGAFGF